MKTAWLSIAVLLAGLLVVQARADDGDSLLLSGDEQALWLLRHDGTASAFELQVKPVDRKWLWAARQVGGDPAALVAFEGAGHVLFETGGYHVFFPGEGDGVPGPRLPGRPIAACASQAFGPNDQAGLIALVRSPIPATAQATTPATPPSTEAVGGPGLVIYQSAAGAWSEIARIDSPGAQWQDDVFAAVFEGTLYVLQHAPNGAGSALVALERGRWREISLPEGAADGKPLALLAFPGRLTSLTSTRTEQGVAVHLADLADGGEWSLQTLTRGGETAYYWPGEALPLVGRLGDRLAAVWQEGDALKFATCSPRSGELLMGPDAVIVEGPLQGQGGRAVQEYFLLALLLAAIVPLVLVRSGTVAQPFSLPDHVRAASLGRRAAAALIDLVPFAAVWTYAMYLMTLKEVSFLEVLATVGRVWMQQESMPEEMAYAWVFAMLPYLAYCMLLERRFSATVGKRLLGLKVVGEQSAKPDMRAIFLRNVVRVVELTWLLTVWLLLPLLLLIPLFTRYHQRLGDMLSRTAVIDFRAAARPPTPPEQEDGASPTDSHQPPPAG